MHDVINTINAWVWSPALVYLCLGAGLFFSIMTRFAQVRQFPEMLRLLRGGQESMAGISTFQALAVSLSGRVGTGNIAGVAAAIGFGGPGAVFWMWVVAFLGASTAYVESTLGQIYKEVDDGEYRGGPAYYIEKALGQKWYGWVFALSTVFAMGLLLPGVQANAIGNAVDLAVGGGSVVQTPLGETTVPKLVTGFVVMGGLGAIIFGGVKRIAHFTQVVVPVMALIYIIGALVVVAINYQAVPGVISLIIGDAFTPMAGFGAVIGWGVKRGIYSNEAGQGTGPHAAAAAEVEHPAQQGLVQAFSVYVDTLLVCSATAFMILITGNYHVTGVENAVSGGMLAATVDPNSPAFTQMAVDQVVGGLGAPAIAVSLFFFAFTTLLAYYYIAESNVAYIKRTLHIPGLMLALKIGLLASAFYGSIRAAGLAWAMGDIGVGLMAWLNIVGILAIFLVGRPAIRALRDYERQQREGSGHYVFDPKALGIRGAEFWEKRLQKRSGQAGD
ncbi:alanine:cation symporter family protein [Marinihelvus fidelis]|uniref:Alanine:cation symporter family protein n=1 Tax=Marinihelvus fidelis TaxID=2613842 RepID=A0A5N0THE6_9GAMM|nr:alanine/glycine:cation symporter family protein [Marinihelvus fidelis]KAA9132719.1 alanine:cation symporter family protein [Marinihelvus fidelis]